MSNASPNFGRQEFFEWGTQWLNTMHRVKLDPMSKLNILELGTAVGSSAYWIAENLLAHNQSTLTTVDHFLNNKQYTQAKVNLSLCANAEKITIVKQAIQQFVFRDLPQYDIIYLDADHDPGPTVYNLYFAEKHLKQGGLLIVDDMHIAGIVSALLKVKSKWSLKNVDTGFEHQTAFTKE